MRITTRIAAGLFLMAALLIGALAYQVSQADRLQEVNRELARTNLEAARVSIQVLEGLEGVREFAAKASALRDQEYRRQWTQWEEAVEEALASLSRIDLSGQEAAIRNQVAAGWRAYRGTAPALWLDPSRLEQVDGMLARVREDVARLISVNEATVAARAQNSAAVGERARIVAWISAAAALLVAGVASMLLFATISGPLRRLTHGTRELAAGRFEYRLDVSGPADLAGLARDFNHMAQRLDELEELKKDFVSHVSHELKSPLAAVHETVEILLDELPGPLTLKQRHLLELARRSSTRLSSMIGNLLETSRLEAGAATYEPAYHDLADLARSIMEELRPVAEEASVAMEFTASIAPAPLVCDGERISEVVANLLGNALKFSPEGTTVDIVLSELGEPPTGVPARRVDALVREQGPFLLLSVADQGEGIPDAHKPRIFEKFHQVAGKQRIRGQGVGLGLAISRRIVEAHGGAVWVEDRPGGGALFRVLLPVLPVRWKDEELGEPPTHPISEVQADAEVRAEVGYVATSAGRATGTAILIALFLVPASGCAVLSGSPADRPAPAEVEAAGSSVEIETPAPSREPPSEHLRLVRGRLLFEQGDFEAADREFEALLRVSADGDERGEALWGRALVHLAAESPLRDEVEARRILAALEAEAPDGVVRAQAVWARLTLEQLDSLRAQVRAQEATVRQLNETLEMLRRIDLDRRPAGGARPPDDAVPDGGLPR